MNFDADEKYSKSSPWLDGNEGQKVKLASVPRRTHFRGFFLAFISLCLHHIFYQNYKHKSQEHTVLYWLESCGAVAFCLLYSVLKKKSLRNVFSSLSFTLWPVFGLYILTVSGLCLDKNTYQGHLGSGSLLFQICISVAPCAALFTKWHIQQEAVQRKSIIFVSLYSCFMLVAVCSNNEFYTTFSESIFGLILGSLLGALIALIDVNIGKVSLFDLFYCLSVVAAVTLPFITVASGEMGVFLKKMNKFDNIMELVKTVCVVGSITQSCLLASLWQISVSGSVVHILTRNLSWVVRTIYIPAVFTYMFLPISSFKAMWITLISFIICAAGGF